VVPGIGGVKPQVLIEKLVKKAWTAEFLKMQMYRIVIRFQILFNLSWFEA